MALLTNLPELRPEQKCIHCGKPTAGRCPRCNVYSCISQGCIEKHNAKCLECPHCGGGYTERREASYRHFNPQTGKVTWCHPKSVERRLAIMKTLAKKKRKSARKTRVKKKRSKK